MLQTEINRLKEQVQGYASATTFSNDPSNYMTPGPDKSVLNPESSVLSQPVPPGQGESPLTHSHVSHFQLQSPLSPIKLPETQPRSLDGKLIDSKTIDECFSLFVRHYSSNLTVLDEVLIPNMCYEESPFLFWTIVTTGARKYQNPTILELLVGRVASLAMSSLFPHEYPLQTIIGLLILCM
ncbi:hypothetical protein ONS95_004992 [Cadophora gregata]|uniref:uncharacterized protein n=1 Tax=Cadophora gregata TaxID=51156 RepID=UPI0026DAECFC|nr:uncharacterized protein ONS95_004992 [Cadophora gregata]KAK0104720.1 hypothetical protein ONS95_004992 [Cadophora gregata]KAK0115197.1 hypothetical protein ONS96_013663 [Cadophora gregata f. sp. sojae]